MGRRILVQRRGKGTQNFRSPKHHKRGAVKYVPLSKETLTGKVLDFIHEGGRGTPLALMQWSNNTRSLWLPPEGIFIGDEFVIGEETEIKVGNTMLLKKYP